jgi:hypothetical protein
MWFRTGTRFQWEKLKDVERIRLEGMNWINLVQNRVK